MVSLSFFKLEGCPPCVENMFRWLMDGLFDDSSKVGVLVRGFWVGKLLVNTDVGPHL